MDHLREKIDAYKSSLQKRILVEITEEEFDSALQNMPGEEFYTHYVKKPASEYDIGKEVKYACYKIVVDDADIPDQTLALTMGIQSLEALKKAQGSLDMLKIFIGLSMALNLVLLYLVIRIFMLSSYWLPMILYR